MLLIMGDSLTIAKISSTTIKQSESITILCCYIIFIGSFNQNCNELIVNKGKHPLSNLLNQWIKIAESRSRSRGREESVIKHTVTEYYEIMIYCLNNILNFKISFCFEDVKF